MGEHERSNRDHLATGLDHQDVELRIGPEALPPRAHPLVRQEGMIDAGFVDQAVPGRFQLPQPLAVRYRFHVDRRRDRQLGG